MHKKKYIYIYIYVYIYIWSHLVDTRVLAPAVSDADITAQDLALGLLLEEPIKVILEAGKVGPGNVADGGKEDGVLGIPAGHDARVAGGQGIVPEVEQGPDLVLGNVPTGRGLGRRLLLLVDEELVADDASGKGTGAEGGDVADALDGLDGGLGGPGGGRQAGRGQGDAADGTGHLLGDLGGGPALGAVGHLKFGEGAHGAIGGGHHGGRSEGTGRLVTADGRRYEEGVAGELHGAGWLVGWLVGR